MQNQEGFVNLDGLLSALVGLGVVFGLILAFGVPWVWGLVKPFIHALTG